MDKKSSQIENFFKSTPRMQKRDSSNISPLDEHKTMKKLNRKDSNISIDNLDMNTHEVNNQKGSNSSLKDIIGPLIRVPTFLHSQNSRIFPGF